MARQHVPRDLFLIRHALSGLVLESDGNRVRLDHFCGSDSQKWFLIPAGCGKHYIVSKKYFKALDIKDKNIVTNIRGSGMSQLWQLNSNGTIKNAVGNLVLEVKKRKAIAGSKLRVCCSNGCETQKFTLQIIEEACEQLAKCCVHG